MASETPHNSVFNHVAVSASEVEATAEWYSRVFGFKLLRKISLINRSETPDAAIFGIYPASLNEVVLAYMVTANGVGYELLEFIDLKLKHAEVFEYDRKGFFHVCVIAPNLDEVAERVEAAAMKHVGKTVDPSGKCDSKCLYCLIPGAMLLKSSVLTLNGWDAGLLIR